MTQRRGDLSELGRLARSGRGLRLLAALTALVLVGAFVILTSRPDARPFPLPAPTRSAAGVREVPDVSGFAQLSATRALSDSGFTVVTRFEPSASVAVGYAIRTDPPQGSFAPEKSDVILFVSSAQ